MPIRPVWESVTHPVDFAGIAVTVTVSMLIVSKAQMLKVLGANIATLTHNVSIVVVKTGANSNKGIEKPPSNGKIGANVKKPYVHKEEETGKGLTPDYFFWSGSPLVIICVLLSL